MDTIISGVKGSGKTYYAVNYINDLPDKEKVLSNIDGLTVGCHISDMAKEWGLQPLDFFKDSFHDENNPRHDERFLDLRGYLFVIDECQKLFPKNFKDQDVLQFFQMSRHYNIDIFLITQHEKLVCPLITVHPELSLRAVSDTANPIPGFFLYKKMIGWEQIGLPIRIRKKQTVFDLYKSADYSKGGERKKARPMIIMISVAILCAVSALVYFKYYTSNRSEIRGKNPTAFVSGKTANLNRFNKSARVPNNDQPVTYSEDSYPKEHIEKIGGVLMPISSINDSTGYYVILLGSFYRLDEFPYPVVRTRLGLSAVVPESLFLYQMKYQNDTALLSQTDPNSPYYYNSSENNDSPSISSVF